MKKQIILTILILKISASLFSQITVNKLVNSEWGPKGKSIGTYINFDEEMNFTIKNNFGMGATSTITGKYNISNDIIILNPKKIIPSITNQDMTKVQWELKLLQFNNDIYYSEGLLRVYDNGGSTIYWNYYTKINTGDIITINDISIKKLDAIEVKNSFKYKLWNEVEDNRIKLYLFNGDETTEHNELPIGYKYKIIGKSVNTYTKDNIEGNWLLIELIVGEYCSYTIENDPKKHTGVLNCWIFKALE